MKDYHFRETYPTFEEFAKTTVYYCTVNSEDLDAVLDGTDSYDILSVGGIEKADLSIKKEIWDAALENDVQIYCTDIIYKNPDFDFFYDLLFTPDDDIELGSIHRCGDYIFAAESDIISDNLSW